ncbi:MAG: aminopeptidase P family protein [candidate division Zixibacteria bacterium]|nr:aminopeptidase P family protein [candidate division Zixibacteria bacterium]
MIYDFHGYNTVAVKFLGLSGVVTRRSFYFIPAGKGEPVAITHKIEEDKFVDLPGKKIAYSSYKILEKTLKETLGAALPDGAKIAMEYSPNGRLPYIGIVDAGTVELIRSFGYDVVSSADIVGALQAALEPARRELHMEAARKMINIKDNAFDFIIEKLKAKEFVNEYDVAMFIMKRFEEEGMVPDHYPIVAIDGWAGNPHYEPPPEGSHEIKNGSLILIDLWAKLDRPDGVVADICWMAYANGDGNETIPRKYTEIFDIVLAAQKAAFDKIKEQYEAGESIYGADADDAARAVITEAGYGELFTHRTGHSIDGQTHGSGPNIDNLETEDKRQLLPGHIFSIEPGIYSFEQGWGFRSEIDVMMTEEGPVVTTTPQQTEILLLFR